MLNTVCNKKYRKIWMFPRPKRKIPPWFLSQTCKLLSLQIEEGWGGDQKIQDEFCSLLERTKLKRSGVQYCSNSGGPRTYMAQLKCLGLVFKRKDGTLWFTRAGEQLLTGSSPLIILQKLLLRLQYPSPYSLSKGVLIDHNIKIKPFQFVLSLMSNEKGLGYITLEELIIPVIYGHSEKDFAKCKSKIEEIRRGTSILKVIDSIDDLWTPRGKNRTVEASLKDIKDIANTVKNYLQSAQLIIEVDVDGRVGYEVDPDMNEFINQEVARGEFFTNPEEEEYFQRRYGCLDRKKDIRTLKRYSGVKDKLTTIKDIIRADFVEFCGKNVVSGIPDDFLNQMIEFHGVSVNDVTEAIEPLLKKSLSFFEEKFLSLSKGEGSSNDFEEVLTSIFQQKLFFKATNTSKRQRPPGEIGGYGDILVVELGNECCGIIDAKASPRYSLSSDDYFKMLENYIPNYQELPEALGKKLEFCLYVAGGFNQTSIQNKLSAFSKTASVPVSAITARNLLALCETFTKSQDQVNIREVFKKGKLIEKDDFSG